MERFGGPPAAVTDPAPRFVSALVPALLFVNTAGSMCVLLRLSTQVGDDTGSGLLAGAVLSAPWLPALVLAGLLHRILAERPPGRLILAVEAVSLGLTAALAAVPAADHLLVRVAVAVLLVRGFFEAVTRSAASVLLRLTVPGDRLGRANTLAEIGRLAGTSAGAALAQPLGALLPLRAFFLLNAGTLACSVLVARALPRTGPAAAGGERATGCRVAVGLIAGDPVLRRLFALFLLVAFWQGFHTIAVTVVPRELLDGGTSLVGVFVALSAVAVFAGSFAALPVQRHLARLPVETWAIVPMLPLLGAVLLARTGPTLASYAAFLVLFEVAYVVFNNLLLGRARPEEVPAVVTVRATLLPLGVVVSILAVGLLTDLTGPLFATVAVAGVTLAVVAAGRVGSSPPVRSGV
ncbi:MAG: MFS transporter [Mycobacteriales bacterium]